MDAQTKKCPSCGRETRASAMFCTQCGAKVDDTAAGSQATPPSEDTGAAVGPAAPPSEPTSSPPPAGSPYPGRLESSPTPPGSTPPTEPPPAAAAPSSAPPPPSRRTPALLIGGIVVAVVIVAGIVFALTRTDPVDQVTGDDPALTDDTDGDAPDPEPQFATPPPGAEFFAWITGISMEGQQYAVGFDTMGFEPRLEGQNKHLHFFFDTVPASQAGVPAGGDWVIHPDRPNTVGASPFSGLGVGDVPPGATQMCVAVANADHSIIVETANCWPLP